MLKTFLNHKQTQTALKISFWFVLFLLVYLTLTPSPPKPISFTNIDKFYHFSAFAGLTFFFTAAYRKINKLTIIMISVLLGVLIEIIQNYVPNRGFSFADMLADTIGVLCGYWIAKKLISD